MDKNEFRKAALQRRRLIIDKEEKSKQIQQQLIDLCKDYKHIAVYMHLKDEVQTNYFIDECLKRNKEIYIPSCINDELVFHKVNDILNLKVGKYGILESDGEISTNFDCMIVPIVACDINKNRMGMGKGYYDKYLQKHLNLNVIGIAFDEQIYDEIPINNHDKSLNMVITPTKVL